jgi:hypothetical protein
LLWSVLTLYTRQIRVFSGSISAFVFEMFKYIVDCVENIVWLKGDLY